MKHILLFPFLVICSVTLFAQTKPVTLNGTLSMNTGETFPYKVVLTEVNGVVSGYSYTYSEPDDTKTKIKGTLDRSRHTLTFKETEIVYSHNVRTKAYMCLVDAKLSYTPGSGSKLKGPITSTQIDKTSCTAGTLTFINDEEIQFLFAYHDKLDTVINMKRKVKDPVVETTPSQPAADVPLVTDKITAGVEKSIDWHTDTVVIDAWDGGNTDGDRITIQLNGKVYLANYYLVKERKQVRIPLPKEGIATIAIIADNEGSDPPNTADLLFTDGTLRYSIVAYNKKGQQSIVKIKRVKR